MDPIVHERMKEKVFALYDGELSEAERQAVQQHLSQMLERFSAKLGLSPEQKTKIQELLESKRQKIKVLRAEVHPKFEEIRNATREEIRQLLTAEQQEKFDAMQSEWESYWKRRR